MAEFRMPDVGEGLHEAELLEWTVAVGDEVREGDTVCVVNTEKVTVDLPSPCDGVVAELPWEVGDTITVGDVLVRFTTAGDPATGAVPDGTAPAAPVPEPAGSPAPLTGAPLAVAPPADAAGRHGDLGIVIAAPSTRRVAADRGIDLRAVTGSGPGGRILRADLDAPATNGSASAAQPPSGAGTRSRSLTGLRALSARNLVRSRSVAVTCTTTFEVRADGLVELLSAGRTGDSRIGLPAVVAVCAAHALASHPDLNGYLVDDGETLALHDTVDVAVAVATDDGLTVPVVRDVGRRRLRDVAAALDELAARARTGELRPEELRGGTFTVSSTGALERDGVLSTTPVINHPQITTLWVGRIQPAPRVAADGGLEVGPVLRASLSFDHRFVDGAEASTFIAALSEALENPGGAVL